MYVCSALVVPVSTTPIVAGAATVTSNAYPGMADPVDTSLAFKLHSRPGAPRTVILDFTGHTATGTAWNPTAPIVSPPYDIDGVPSSFSQQELANIIAIWRNVAEDYSPFEVRTKRGRKPDGGEGGAAARCASACVLLAAARSGLPSAGTVPHASPNSWSHGRSRNHRIMPGMRGSPRGPSLAPPCLQPIPYLPNTPPLGSNLRLLSSPPPPLHHHLRSTSPPRRPTPPATPSTWPTAGRASSSEGRAPTGSAPRLEASLTFPPLACRTTR